MYETYYEAHNIAFTDFIPWLLLIIYVSIVIGFIARSNRAFKRAKMDADIGIGHTILVYLLTLVICPVIWIIAQIKAMYLFVYTKGRY
jgi:hypothetical protein